MLSYLVQTIAPATDNLGEMLLSLITAAKGGEWSLVVAVAIMMLVWLATKTPVLKSFLTGKRRIWAAAIAGVAGAVVATWFTTGSWFTAVLNGLLTGTAAGGLWSLIGKKFLSSSDK